MTQSEDFAKIIAFVYMIAFLEHLEFFQWFLAQNNSKRFLEWILTCFFWDFNVLAQSKEFARAIAFA